MQKYENKRDCNKYRKWLFLIFIYKDKLLFKRKRFTDVAWKFVYESLIKNGYKRIGFNSALFKSFDDTTVYDMYIDKDFDRLVKYYSCFTKQ